MPYDPFNLNLDELLDPMAPLRKAKREPAVPPIDPEQASSTLERIGHSALGGLAFVGGILDKPGRAVRGILGGRPEEALNLIPFSDALGITDVKNRVSGQELLGEKGEEGWGPMLRGLAAEIATDPLTLLTFGGSALSKGGQIAKMIGKTPKGAQARIGGTLEQVLAKEPALQGAAEAAASKLGVNLPDVLAGPLGGHVGIGLPFAKPMTTLNLSPVLDPLSSVLGWGWGKVPGSGLVNQGAGALGRSFGALFQNSKMDQVDLFGQRLATSISEGTPEAIARGLEEQLKLNVRAKELGLHTPAGSDELRQTLEGVIPGSPGAQEIASAQRAVYERQLSRANLLGLPDKPLGQDALTPGGPPIGYTAREQTIHAAEGPGWLKKKSLTPEEQAMREKIFSGVPTTGSNSINELSKNKSLSGPGSLITDPVQRQNEVFTTYLRQNPAEYTALQAVPPAQRTAQQVERLAEIEARLVQANHLQDWSAKLPPVHAEKGIGYFDNHVLADAQNHTIAFEARMLKAEKTHSALASVAIPATAAAGADVVPLSKVLTDAGMTFRDPVTGDMTAMSAIFDAMRQSGHPIASAADLGTYMVPRREADVLKNFTKLWTTPDGMVMPLKIFDTVTNWTKAYQTVFWPANWVRNQMTAVAQNWINDAYNPLVGGKWNPAAYSQPWQAARAWKAGDVIPFANKIPGFEHLSEQAASKAFAIEYEARRLAKHTQQGMEIIGGTGLTREAQALKIPGEFQPGIKEAFKDYIPKQGEGYQQLNPFATSGSAGFNADIFTPVKAGRNINSALDDLNQFSVYYTKRLQGFAPDAARSEVIKTHFDFGNLSNAEKSVMRRLVPFYSWLRQSIPTVISELIEKPGGKLGQIVKGIGNLQQDQTNGFVPEYLSKGIAVPIGEEKAGTMRFLSQLGLPVEDTLGLYNPKGLARSGLAMLSQANPLLKAPLEYMTGKQFYSGRDLADLRGITDIPLIDQLVMNSPFSRFYTTGRTAFDERKDLPTKAMNILTGAKVTDVDMEKQRQIAARDYITELFQGNPKIREFTRLYPDKTKMATLTPQELEMMGLYNYLLRVAQEKAKSAATP